MKKTVKLGAIASVIGLFPIAFLMALLWRFPLPFAGYQSGLEAAVKSPLAVAFYGIMGGFVLVPALGAMCAALVFKTVNGDQPKARRLTIFLALVIAFVSCLFLSILDHFIGEW